MKVTKVKMRLFNTIKTYTEAFLGLIYPELCTACGTNLYQQEKILCTKCLYNLPRTYFHKVPSNPIEQSLWGRVDIERASALYFFQKADKYQKLLHLLKYKNRKDIGIELGRLYGADLVLEEAFNKIDYIIPVPLHRKKLHKRGFNQSEIIAKGLKEFIPAQLRTDILIRKKKTDTQTRKSRYERWENIQDVFSVKNSKELNNKHILLVDDVFTTGATIEGCAIALHNAADVKISVVTLAYASKN